MKYSTLRSQMRPGDLIGFSGKGPFSTLIKAVTVSDISHVGVILQTQIDNTGKYINQIIESTSLTPEFAGVQINRMSARVRDYEGDIYLYSLTKDSRKKLDLVEFFQFMLKQNKKPYDTIQAGLSALDLIPDTKEDLRKLFCSELVTAGYEVGGLINNINASEQTPKDVCNFGYYEKRVKIDKG